MSVAAFSYPRFTSEPVKPPVLEDDIWTDFYIHRMNKTDIGKKYGISRWAVDRRLKKTEPPKPSVPTDTIIQGARRAENSGMPEPAYRPAYPTRTAQVMGAAFEAVKGKREIPASVDEAYDLWTDWLGYDPGRIHTSQPRPAKAAGDRKIVIANDLHAPFEDQAAIKALIEENAHDTDLLIIGGDLLDLFAVSRYEKFAQHYSLVEEFRAGKALINLLASRFPKIRMIGGNHDERWKKHLVQKRGMGPAELEAMNLLCRMATGDDEFDLTDPLYCLVRDLPNVELVKPVVKDYARFSFFLQEGDMIVSHAEKFSRLTGQAAAQAAMWFKSCAVPSGICNDFRVYIQTHNHQASTAWGNFGVWNIEAGCMCLTPDYAANPRLMGAQRPPITGYTVIYQDAQGRTDMRRSRFVPLKG